jgi:hypothetical protein
MDQQGSVCLVVASPNPHKVRPFCNSVFCVVFWGWELTGGVRNGHACCLQYVLLHLFGYGLPMEQLKRFRQIGSHTPGHPEANHGTPGIEVTTGPLGQGAPLTTYLAHNRLWKCRWLGHCTGSHRRHLQQTRL